MSNGSAENDKPYEVDETLGGSHNENSVEKAEGTKENPDCNGLKIIDKGNPIEVVRGDDEKVATVQGMTVAEMKRRDLLALFRKM